MVAAGFLVLIGGIAFSWVGGLMVYGFGQLVDDTQAIRQNIGESARFSFAEMAGYKQFPAFLFLRNHRAVRKIMDVLFVVSFLAILEKILQVRPGLLHCCEKLLFYDKISPSFEWRSG